MKRTETLYGFRYICRGRGNRIGPRWFAVEAAALDWYGVENGAFIIGTITYDDGRKPKRKGTK